MNLFASLLSDHIQICETRLDAKLDSLAPEEALCVKRAVAERTLEFRAGRHCAKRALARLGCPTRKLAQNADRSPVWPPAVIGSICHTREVERGYAAAAVAHASRCRGLGIDAEPYKPLPDGVSARIMNEAERAELSENADRPGTDDQAQLLGRVVFSAKEAVYKCLYPSVGRFFGFEAVELRLDRAHAQFVARLQERLGPFAPGFELRGRYATADGLVVCAVELPA